MDLLQFPKSSNQNVVALVVVDHKSKWLTAVPLKDKKAATVARAVKEQVLPHILKLPNRVLTDNGPEFISHEFNELLDSYNVTHIYSTRYRAAGNGAVEHCNRTITEFLKGLIDDNKQAWDTNLYRALIVYNNTVHSQLGISPSQFLLNNSHTMDNILPLDRDTISTWNEGHAKFVSFKVDQLIALKINKIGNRVHYKLDRKYTGPYKIIKIQSNGVTYEVRELSSGIVRKVHHRQIKPWIEPPMYLRKYLDMLNTAESVVKIKDRESSDESIVGCVAITSSGGSSSEDERIRRGNRGNECRDKSNESSEKLSGVMTNVGPMTRNMSIRGRRNAYYNDADQNQDGKNVFNDRDQSPNTTYRREYGASTLGGSIVIQNRTKTQDNLLKFHCSEVIDYNFEEELVKEMYQRFQELKISRAGVTVGSSSVSVTQEIGRAHV
jgi:hypothetical protein